MGISIFSKVKWLALQQPLILLAGMLTGRNVMEILAMEVHERAKLLDVIIGEVKDITAAMVVSTDPAGDGGVTITEPEMAVLIDEADDPKAAVIALLEYNTSKEDGSNTGQ